MMYEEQAPNCMPGQERDDQRRSCRVEVERSLESAASLAKLRHTIILSGSSFAGPSMGDTNRCGTICVEFMNIWVKVQ